MTTTQLAFAIPAVMSFVYVVAERWWQADMVRAIERDPETRLRREMEATR